ncbi:MAG: hypothetical protein Q9213_007067 [Squamulea squamosa]
MGFRLFRNFGWKYNFLSYITSMILFTILIRYLLVSWYTRPSTAIETWCGKAYHQGDPEVTPGGRIGPAQVSEVPLIDVAIRPRLSLYLDGEKNGSFIVDATASRIHGQPWDADSSMSNQSKLNTGTVVYTTGDDDEILTVNVIHMESGAELLPRTTIKFNETSKEFLFLTETLKASLAPQPIKLELTHADGRKFEATTALYYLPNPKSTQSITRIDSLCGGLQVRTSNLLWLKIFPYSFYLSGAWLASDPTNLKRFRDLGFNILHIIPGGEGIGYDLDQLDAWFEEAEKLGLWIMYDMRWTYQNSDYVKTQVERYKTRRNMLLYYTADEPAHGVEQSCNSTPCNESYGDCGCDNCITSPTSPALTNIPSRLDLWSSFRTQLGLPHNPIWSVPQAFTQQDFWTRTPSPQEVIAMILLSLNHGAKGIVMWVFPTADEIIQTASRFSKAVLGPHGILDEFVTSTEAVRVAVVGARDVDAAMWRAGSYMMISAVNAGEERIEGEMRLKFGEDVSINNLRSILLGSPGWRLEGKRAIVRNGMDGLASWVIVFDIDEDYNKGTATN